MQTARKRILRIFVRITLVSANRPRVYLFRNDRYQGDINYYVCKKIWFLAGFLYTWSYFKVPSVSLCILRNWTIFLEDMCTLNFISGWFLHLMTHVAGRSFEKIKIYLVLINFFQQFFIFKIIRKYMVKMDRAQIKYNTTLQCCATHVG
jgi:hypothetical protein